MKKFTYIELFAGIGGFRQALDQLGGECVLSSEIDKYANQSYKALYGHETAGDVMKIQGDDVPDHDILVGGFPCQAFSVAGKRGGFEDARGTLFFEALRIAEAKRPKALFLENVKGLVSHDKGKTLDTMIKALNEIGYAVDFEILNSKFFGVPQNRERIFIIAMPEDAVNVEPWKIEGNNIIAKGKKRNAEYETIKTFNFDWPTGSEEIPKLKDVLETHVDEKYYLSEEKTAALVAELDSKNQEKMMDVNAMITDDGPQHKYNVKNPITPPIRANGGGRTPGVWVIQKSQSGIRLKKESGTLRKGGVDHQHLVEPQGLPIREATQKGYAEAKVEKTPVSYNRNKGIGKERETALCLSSSDWRGLNRNQDQNAVLEKTEITPDGQINDGEHPAHCIEASYNKGLSPSGVGKGKRTHVLEPKIAEEIRPVLTPDRAKKRQNGRRFKEDGEESFTLTAQDKHGVMITQLEEITKKSRPNEEIEYTFKENGDIRPHRTDKRKSGISELNVNYDENASHTVTTSHAPKIYGVSTKYRIRKLTPLECWRLQGFSDEAHETVKAAGVSDSQRYKQAGNAVTVNVIHAIGERLLEAMEQEKKPVQSFLSDDDRKGMLDTLSVLGGKSEEYYNRCTDEQLDYEYKKFLGLE